MTQHQLTQADRWRDAINEAYPSSLEEEIDLLTYLGGGLSVSGLVEDGEDEQDAIERVLGKAAQCLRNGIPATFTGAELDLVRHLMPAHKVHQSGAVRWVLDNYGQ